MNVRFFAGTRAQYDSIPAPRNPLALYFCEDTKELFWADRLLTDGMRVVPTYADLPSPADAADGVVYYVTETRNGYVVPHGTKNWLQTIYAPVLDVTKVPESEIYNTVTTVGAVRDIEEKIYNHIEDRIANIEVDQDIKSIYFAGYELIEVDGHFVIDRRCAREALGFKLPEGLEEAEVMLATKGYVDSAIEAISIPDFSEYAKKDEIPTIEGLATEAFVQEQIKAIPEVDLNGYAKKEDIPTDYLTAIPDEYVTEAELALEGFATEEFVNKKIAEAELADKEADLEAYYTKSEVDALIPSLDGYAKTEDIPTDYVKLSDLSEYSKFSGSYNDLTDKPEIPSINGLATEEYVNEKLAEIEIPEVDLTDYATKNDIDAVESKIPSVDGLASESYVNEKIAEIEHPLENYVTKEEIEGFIKEIPNSYVTEEELEAKGYLTEHIDISGKADVEHTHTLAEITDYTVPEIPSIEGLATEEYVDNAIAGIEIPEADLSSYYNKLETDELIASAVVNKVDKILFTDNKYVTNPIGNFVVGDNIKDFTIEQLFAKLLGLSDTPPTQEPEVPDVSKGIIETIKENKIPMYAISNTGSVEVEPYKLTNYTDETSADKPTESCFYQVIDESGNVIEAGYQQLSAVYADMPYLIALPKVLDFASNVEVQYWNDLENCWKAKTLNLSSDIDIFESMFGESPYTMFDIDANEYTVWFDPELGSTGAIYRFIIIE